MIRLPKVNEKKKKRLGRGMGSGKGSHTSSRGQKGQKSRTNIHVLFEGMKTKKSLLKRLPLMRGKGKFHSRKGKTARYVTKSKSKVKPAPKASK
jgi:large subunit ribosomal protein L15